MSRLIAIASGKGGVGKTLITASLSVLLQRRGYRVLAADADMGLRNLDLLFGMGDAVRYDASQAAGGNVCPDRPWYRSVPASTSCRPVRSGLGKKLTCRLFTTSWNPWPVNTTTPSLTARRAAMRPIGRRRPWPTRFCSSSNRRRRHSTMPDGSCSIVRNRNAFTTTSFSIIFTPTVSFRQPRRNRRLA